MNTSYTIKEQYKQTNHLNPAEGIQDVTGKVLDEHLSLFFQNLSFIIKPWSLSGLTVGPGSTGSTDGCRWFTVRCWHFSYYKEATHLNDSLNLFCILSQTVPIVPFHTKISLVWALFESKNPRLINSMSMLLVVLHHFLRSEEHWSLFDCIFINQQILPLRSGWGYRLSHPLSFIVHDEPLLRTPHGTYCTSQLLYF